MRCADGVQYYLAVSRCFSGLSARISGEYWTLPNKFLSHSQVVRAFLEPGLKPACRWFDSAPGHHLDQRVGSTSRPPRSRTSAATLASRPAAVSMSRR
jgi:hypothetical protein